MNMTNIGFFPAHPSQLWMMYSLAQSAPENVKIFWYIRDKDIMVNLAEELGIDYILVSEAKTGYLGNALEMFLNIFKFLRYSKNDGINIWFSKYGAVNIAAWLKGIKNFSFNDDDADIVPFIAMTSYPFSDGVFCTEWTRMGKYEKKAIRYKSLHELFYLNPDYFSPSKEEAFKFLKISLNEKYVLIRLSSLKAHHDLTAKGVSDLLLEKIIHKLEKKFRVFISSEKQLEHKFQKYQIRIPTSKMHTVLAFSSLVIGDSLTMITEAAMLGVPNLRISSFSGKIGTLNELERQGLTKSLQPDDEPQILSTVDNLINHEQLEYQLKCRKFVEDTVDPIKFVWKRLIQ